MHDDPMSIEEQVTDLAELKAAKTRREHLGRGTDEWAAAMRVEQDLVDRIRRWTYPPRGNRP